MNTSKYKQNNIVNNNLSLFGGLFFCGVIYLGLVNDYWYFLFIVFIPLILWKNRSNWKQWICMSLICVIFVILAIFIPNFSLIDLINKRPKFIRNSILSFYDRHYNKEIASFIKLILFNIKSTDSWIFYKQTVDLGIVWLICVSGFHISLISRLIKRIFIKIPKIGKYVNITIIGFYSFLLNFSYSSLRVWFKLIFDWLFYRFRIKGLNKLGFIGLILCLLNPKCFADYGFLLSFMICTVAYLINKLNLNNKILSTIAINLFAITISIPIIIDMNHKISLLTFINSFIFTYVSAFIFLYFVIFSIMPFMSTVHYGIMIMSYILVGNISFSNIFIYSNSWPLWSVFIYYLGFFGLEKVLYLIVYNNKI